MYVVQVCGPVVYLKVVTRYVPGAWALRLYHSCCIHVTPFYFIPPSPALNDPNHCVYVYVFLLYLSCNHRSTTRSPHLARRVCSLQRCVHHQRRRGRHRLCRAQNVRILRRAVRLHLSRCQRVREKHTKTKKKELLNLPTKFIDSNLPLIVGL